MQEKLKEQRKNPRPRSSATIPGNGRNGGGYGLRLSDILDTQGGTVWAVFTMGYIGGYVKSWW